MTLSTHEDIVSTDRLRSGLGLAIAEARMVKSLLQRKNLAPSLEQVKQLVNLEREIDYLETTLFELESKDSQ